MDPDVALTDFRDWMRQANKAVGDDDSRQYCLGKAAEVMEVLDDWLTIGGFLPAEWSKRAPVVTP